MPPPVHLPNSPVRPNPSDSLSDAAKSTSASLVQLNQTEQAAYPPKRIVPAPPSPSCYGMGFTATVNWNGPIEPLAQKIADAASYKLLVFGKRPLIPVIILIDTKNEQIGNILRDAGYQAGKRATVVVIPATRTIELRYSTKN